MIETSLLRTIYTGLTRVFLYGIPMVTLVCGILLIVKKISKGKGVCLCILSVLFLIPVLPSNWEYFTWFGTYIVAGQIFTGIMLVGIGVKERKKNLESRDTRFGTIFIAVGIICTTYIFAVMIFNGIIRTGENREYIQSHPVSTAFFADDNIDEFKTLLENGAKLDETVTFDRTILQESLVTRSTQYKEPELIEKTKLLLESGYDVNEKDDRGVTLLMYASLDGMKEYTAAAVLSDQFDSPTKLTELFLSYGADVNAVDNFGHTALILACAYKGGIFQRHNIDVLNSPAMLWPDGNNFLYPGPVFISTFHYDQIKSLIDAGADIHAKDNRGFTARDYFEFAVEFSMNLNPKDDGEELVAYYQSQEYADLCKAVDELLR